MNETHQNDRRTALRRKGLKVLAFFERTRVRMLHGWEKVAETAGKARRAFAKHPVSPLLYLVILALMVGYVTFDGMYTQAYVLTVDGEEMGLISGEADVETMVAHLESRASGILGEEYAYDADIQLSPAITTNNGFSDMNAIEDSLFANVGALTEAYALSVDGVELGVAPSLAEMYEMLDQVAAPYVTEYTLRYEFVEDVQVYPVELPSNTRYDLDSLYAILTAFTIEEAYYTVKAGDTFNQIAYNLGMTPADLSALNPGININKIYVGQELIIQEAVPFLSVRTVENKTYESVIHSPIEEIPTANLYVGNSQVKEQGTDGLALENADITYVNGVEMERTILTSETLEEATTTYMYVGTTPRPKTASNGYYIWPTATHKITSPYGYRYIFGAYEFHLGIDLGASYGSNIRASDGGKVTYAGWKGSYGKLIIITHDNGSQTYYAHCSSLLVSVGDRVYQGQTIGRVGSTGNSTGPHLHFEIRINGKTVNPVNYLN